MADYIDRQAAIDALAEELAYKPEGYWDSGLNQYDVEVVLNQQPSVDAVEVVRCQDCKHRYIDGENVRYNVCDLNHNKVQEDYWYCADGERKDG